MVKALLFGLRKNKKVIKSSDHLIASEYLLIIRIRLTIINHYLKQCRPNAEEIRQLPLNGTEHFYTDLANFQRSSPQHSHNILLNGWVLKKTL